MNILGHSMLSFVEPSDSEPNLSCLFNILIKLFHLRSMCFELRMNISNFMKNRNEKKILHLSCQLIVLVVVVEIVDVFVLTFTVQLVFVSIVNIDE